MTDSTSRLDRAWEEGWEGHALAQRRRLASLPLWEKIAWLEEAQALASFMRRRPLTRTDADEGAPAEPPQSST